MVRLMHPSSFNATRLLEVLEQVDCFFLTYRVAFFSGPPPNLTKSQAHYKLLDLGNLGGGPVQFIQGLGLSQIRGGPEKKATLYVVSMPGFAFDEILHHFEDQL